MSYMRILSKSSLISSSSVKSFTPSEEVAKLLSEIENLRHTVESLKLTVETRDAAIGTLAREKEKLYIELKTAQRTNRNLHQQLDDERDMHAKEKEFLIDEIKRLAKTNKRNDIGCDEGVDNLLIEEIKNKDEIICNICSKYMKMKASKVILLEEFQKLQARSEKACEEIICILQDNKKSLDGLLNKIIEYSYVPPSSKHFLKILRTNSNLHYENTQLKIRFTSPIPKQFANAYCDEEKRHRTTRDGFRKKTRSQHETKIKQDPRNSVSFHSPQRDKSLQDFKTINHNTSMACVRTSI